MANANLICVAVDKQGKGSDYDVFANAWRALIQRFENTLAHHNFAGPRNPDDRGILYADDTNGGKLTALVRRMRRHNPIPSQPQFGSGFRNLPLAHIVENPTFRRSHDSFFLQAVDVTSYLLFQSLNPNACMKAKAGHKYFSRLAPIVCRAASPGDPEGVARL
jgi:hypothetical protein